MAQYFEGGSRKRGELPKPLERGAAAIRKPLESGKPHALFAAEHPDKTISGLYKKIAGNKLTVDQAAEAVLDEVLPQTAVCPTPVRNIQTASDILKYASQDEFTKEALSVLEGGDAKNQQEFKAELKPFALKRCVFNLFCSTSTKYQQINGNYLTFKDELNHGGELRNHPLLSCWQSTDPLRERIERQRRTLNTLSVQWGPGSEESRIQTHRLSTENPAFSWHELFVDDTLDVGLTMHIEGLQHKMRGGGPVTEEDLAIMGNRLEKTRKELTAAGLILARDDVTRKWSYFDHVTDSNYLDAINRLNNGEDANLVDAVDAVKKRFPKAMQKKD
ncbi:MAG: hypothetical protein GF334_03130 [Candidatus Altiarchaeales archaeon]|nr:hypothetical protein [Candidatus Altiarchaeales archaeon]